jgi:hypothetical protein
LHEEPNRARYYFEGDVINYVFDNQMANSIIEENIALIRKYHKHFSQGNLGKFNSAFQIISILELDQESKQDETSSQDQYSSDGEEFTKVERQNKSEVVNQKSVKKEQESEQEESEEMKEARRPSEAVCQLPDQTYLARILKKEGDHFIVDEFKELQEEIESWMRQQALDDLQSNSFEGQEANSSIRPKELKEKNNEYLLSNEEGPPELCYDTDQYKLDAFPKTQVSFFWGADCQFDEQNWPVFRERTIIKEFLQEITLSDSLPTEPPKNQTKKPSPASNDPASVAPQTSANFDYRFFYFPQNEAEREFLNRLQLSEADCAQEEYSGTKSLSNQQPEMTVFSENDGMKDPNKFIEFDMPLKKIMSTPPIYLLNELDIEQLDSKTGLIEVSTEKTRGAKEEKIQAQCIESEENQPLFISKAAKKKNRQVKKKEKKQAKLAVDHSKMKKNSTVTDSIDISEIQKGGNKPEEDSDEEKQLLFFINESKSKGEGKEPSSQLREERVGTEVMVSSSGNERHQELQEEAGKGSEALKERKTGHTERSDGSRSRNPSESAAKEGEDKKEKEDLDHANDKKKKKRKKKKKKEAPELKLGPKLSSFQEQLLRAQSQEEVEELRPAKKVSEELMQEKPEVSVAFQFAQQIREHTRLHKNPIELVLGMIKRIEHSNVKGLKIELDADLKKENGLIRLIAEGENITSN